MTYQAQASLPYFSGLPTDVITNVWHFDWLGGTAPNGTNFSDLVNLIAGFYELVFEDGGPITMAPWCVPANFNVRVYNLEDPEPRVPVHTQTSALTVEQSSTSIVPCEVSIVLSYRAELVSGTNPARRRGRFYLGGFAVALTQGDTNDFPMVDPLTIGQIIDGAESVANNGPALDWQWVVWSRTDQESHPVVGGWVDNALDTQRRRGVAATIRTNWAAGL